MDIERMTDAELRATVADETMTWEAERLSRDARVELRRRDRMAAQLDIERRITAAKA